MEMKLREASFSVKLYIWNKRSTIFGALTGALTLSLLLKLPPRKLEPEFFVLYLYKSTIRSCVKCCCHVWAGTPICYLELLDQLQNPICRTVGPSLAASLEPWAHCQNIASLNLFYRYYFGRCSSELAQLVPFPYSQGSLLVILIVCMIVLSRFLDVKRMSMPKVCFLNLNADSCSEISFLKFQT